LDHRLSLAKLSRPRLHAPLERSRLFNRLDAWRNSYPAVSVVAPPGAGKTTLVGSWLDSRTCPGIWYQVDVGDAEVATFFLYLVQAAQPFFTRQKRLPLLTQEYAQNVTGFARRFFRELFSLLPQQSVFVLDNLQEVDASAPLHSIIVEAIEQAPKHVLIILVSRSVLPAQYIRLTANESIANLGWEELRLTTDETRKLIESRGILDAAAIGELHEYSGGWAAGVILVLERWRQTGVLNSGTSMFSMESIFSYFATQLMNQIPPEAGLIILKCAIFESVNARLAHLITNNAKAVEVLEDLYRRHLFVDRRHKTEFMYQFHALFRAFLLHKLTSDLPSEEVSLLRHTAASLLEEEGRIDEASALYSEMQDWRSIKRIVLNHADSMLVQGRHKTIREWITNVPPRVLTETPLLSYWLGQSWLGEDLLVARQKFEVAYAGLRNEADEIGQLLTMAGIMETHYFSWSRFRALDEWIAEMCRLLESEPKFESMEMELRIYGALLMAMHHRAPRNPWLARSVESIKRLLSEELSDDRRVRAGCILLGFAHAASNLSLGQWIVEKIGPITERGQTTSLSQCMWLGRLALHLAHKGQYSDATTAVDQAELLAKENELVVDGALRSFWGVLATLNGGDLCRAEEFVRQLEMVAEEHRPAERAMAYYCRCMISLAEGKQLLALESGRSAVRIANCEGVFWLQVNCASVAAYAMIDAGCLDEAAQELDNARKLVAGTFFPAFEAEIELGEAALAFARSDHQGCHFHLREACRISQETSYIFFNRAMPRPLRHAIGEALRENVEAEYFRTTIRRFGLWPTPYREEWWPWSMRLRLLGPRSLLLGGLPPDFSRKAPNRVLMLLFAIVALGGREVPDEKLVDALWPDSDADAAYGSLDVTVKRLRELLGRKSAVRYAGGRLSLEREGCWIDVWEFERSLDVENDPARAVGLYGGIFMDGEDAAWALPIRERLRAKYLGAVSRIGENLEKMGRHEQAIKWYEKAVEIDALAESLYQGVIRSNIALDRPSDATRAYHRLKEILFAHFGTAPSPVTENLYSQVSRLATSIR